MKPIKTGFLIVALFAVAVVAQNPSVGTQVVNTTPSGACGGAKMWYLQPDGSVYTCQNGTAANLAATGAAGATGPTGATGATAPSSSRGPTGSVAMTGSDVTLYTFTSVPALAAGGCYTFRGVFATGAAASHTLRIKVDGTTVATPMSAFGANYIYNFETGYCNTAGSQTTQRVVPIYGAYTLASAWQFSQGLTNYFSEPGSYPVTPTAVDWSTSHTITVTMTAASGTAQGYFFSYY